MTDQLTRRELLQRAAAGGSVLTLPGLLAACGGSSKSSSGSGSGNHKLAKTLNFSNWTLYMDTNKKKHTFPSLIEFQKKYGVHVNYAEDVNDNASFFGTCPPDCSREAIAPRYDSANADSRWRHVTVSSQFRSRSGCSRGSRRKRD